MCIAVGVTNADTHIYINLVYYTHSVKCGERTIVKFLYYIWLSEIPILYFLLTTLK